VLNDETVSGLKKNRVEREGRKKEGRDSREGIAEA
jgi:hypothetical protein